MNLDRPTPVGCCCNLQTCTIVSSISFTRMNQESQYEISLLCQGKTKLSYHMSIQSCHLVCKFWCQNVCVCLWGPRSVSTVKWMVFGPVVPGPLWKTSSSEALEENELLDTWPLDIGWPGYRCDTSDSSSKPPLYLELLLLRASVS